MESQTYQDLVSWADAQGLQGEIELEFKESAEKKYQDSEDPITYARVYIGGKVHVLSVSHYLATNVNFSTRGRRTADDVYNDLIEMGEIRNFIKEGETTERWAFMKKDNSKTLVSRFAIRRN